MWVLCLAPAHNKAVGEVQIDSNKVKRRRYKMETFQELVTQKCWPKNMILVYSEM